MDGSVVYKLMLLTSSKSQEFIDAMRIYTQSIEHIQKTNTSEIKHWVDHCKKFPLGNLLFFVLLSNDVVIGYAELAYIKSRRIVIIDYITIDKQYNTNGAFYSFYWLIIDHINRLGLDYDFITKEILCKYDSTNLYLSEIKMYEMENFKVANCLYIQPLLEKTNDESEKESLLMIYQKAIESRCLKNTTYLSIVSTLYLYYQTWDEPFVSASEKQDYISNFQNYLDKIKEDIDAGESVTLNGYPKKHSFSSDDKCIPSKNRSVQNALIYTIIIIVIAFCVLFFAKELNIELTTIAIVCIAVIFIFLSFVALSDSKAAKIIKNLPVFSKLFALLK